jgi:hypothetical protein
MFGGAKQRLILGEFAEARLELLEFEKTTLLQIKSIWKDKNDVDYDEAYLEQETLPYKWQDPLYVKMIHRYRNCHRRIAQFYHQIDPHNQWLLLARLLPVCMGRTKAAGEMVSFLAWTSNMLGYYDIQKLLSGDEADAKIQGELLQNWRHAPIAFFFGLSAEAQETLLARYNREEIDLWNEHIASKGGKESLDAKKEVDPVEKVSYTLPVLGPRKDSGPCTVTMSGNDYQQIQNLLNQPADRNEAPTRAQMKDWLNRQMEEITAIDVEKDLEVSDSSDEPVEVKETLTDQVYVLTEKGRHHLDLLGEKHSDTPEGKVFRSAMTEADWQLEQLLVLANPYDGEEGTSKAIFVEALSTSKRYGAPQIHIDMLAKLDELLALAVQLGLLSAT